MINETNIAQELLDFHNRIGDYSGLATNTNTSFIQERVATLWKNIINNGFSSIIPASTTVSIAANTLYTSLNVIDAGTSIYAFYASAMSTIGNGMVGYSIVSPPIPLILNAPFSNINTSCNTIASQLVACARTGQSMLIAPPNTVMTWS
jgi:hypothetical protein